MASSRMSGPQPRSFFLECLATLGYLPGVALGTFLQLICFLNRRGRNQAVQNNQQSETVALLFLAKHNTLSIAKMIQLLEEDSHGFQTPSVTIQLLNSMARRKLVTIQPVYDQDGKKVEGNITLTAEGQVAIDQCPCHSTIGSFETFRILLTAMVVRLTGEVGNLGS